MAVYRSDYTEAKGYYPTLVASYEYDPWGKVTSVKGSAGTELSLSAYPNHIAHVNPIRYRGYYYDNETGFYYLQSRYYDPAICRFINADEYSDTDDGLLGFNMFAYCLNNPMNRTDSNGNWSLSNLAKVAIGVAAIAVGVVATAVTGGAAAPVLIASVQMAASSAATGAVIGGISGAVKHRITTGSWKGAGKAALDGAIDGAADGFMTGGIAAGATFTTVAAKGIKIQEIGRLKPSGKSGDGYPGVKYKVKKANGKYTTKSFELHSPHKGGDHNFWHWQQNTWSEYNGVSRISSKKALHWRIWGKRVS